MELKIKTENILIGAWLNDSNKNIILACGLPQYISKHHPIVKMAETARVNLFVPRYIGSWESSGIFSIANCVETIEKTIALVKKGKAIELYNNTKTVWNPEKIYLLGFSFGGISALLNTEKVSKTILLNPFANLDLQQKFNGENIEETFEFLQRAFPNVYKFDSKEIINELKSLNYPDKKEKMIVIRGKEDKTIPKEETEWLVNKYKPEYIEVDGGHSLELNKKNFEQILNN